MIMSLLVVEFKLEEFKLEESKLLFVVLSSCMLHSENKYSPRLTAMCKLGRNGFTVRGNTHVEPGQLD